MSELIFAGGTLVTMDDAWQVVRGDLHVQDGVIRQVGGDAVPQGDNYDIIDCTGCLVLPGLVQTHVHTCQTLARGHADGLPLLDWLRDVIWPYENQLGPEDVAASARLSAAELVRGGTTCIQDMGTVRHTEQVFQVMEEVGLRAVVGKALMDSGDGVPPGLAEPADQAMRESIALFEQFHGAAEGRLGHAFCPRFVLSCSEGLLRECVAEARRLGSRIHTHASENQDELATVRKLRGEDNVTYLHSAGMTGPDVGLAHCVWLSDSEQDVLVDSGTHLLHCPSSNLKLASGIAPIAELVARGASVSLGADGAPCNNNLDAFQEMRLAAIVHLPRAGAASLAARDVVRMATRGGARALGLEDSIGTLEIGKRGDVIAVDVTGPHVAPTESPYSALAYACHSRDVRHVAVDGRTLVRDGEPLGVDTAALVADAHTRARRLFASL